MMYQHYETLLNMQANDKGIKRNSLNEALLNQMQLNGFGQMQWLILTHPYPHHTSNALNNCDSYISREYYFMLSLVIYFIDSLGNTVFFYI